MNGREVPEAVSGWIDERGAGEIVQRFPLPIEPIRGATSCGEYGISGTSKAFDLVEHYRVGREGVRMDASSSPRMRLGPIVPALGRAKHQVALVRCEGRLA